MLRDDKFSNDGPEKRGRFSAMSPIIRVHDLSESVFCPRAGVISHEKADDDADQEPQLGPKLSGFWNFDEHRFNQAITETLIQFVITSSAFFAICVFGFIGTASSIIWLPVAFLGSRCVGGYAWRSGAKLFNLVLERYRLKYADVKSVELRPTKIQYLNWWVLRKFGFECFAPDEKLGDNREKLAGKPWRILRYGDGILVPVVRKHLGSCTKGQQHTVRLMAYCHLIEHCTNAESPFGVLLFNKGDECVVIPNNRKHKKEFRDALADFRDLLLRGNYAEELDNNPQDTRCRGCKLGEPRKYKAGKTTTILDGQELVPMIYDDYHCDCGDRFCWQPLHEKTLAMIEMKESSR